ncbi:TIGR02594 family protein [Shewanella sp. 3_MG-2023]|uniref:NlpC/P60 family protein n=1 Tax=Shewanella sp. 3_MG-2023 TaxID=3062635 RepID=UPI0026E449B4|nr:TIGR02594 family protein [Shewanella sp. 3_MG-2023]MDO6777199.1 TIGR02594 family protein [Shewanella sp. 3_MG-2023]
MSSIKLTQAVGLGGANNLNDVKAVQTALNKLLKLIPPTQSLKIDGRLGSRPDISKTVAAIKLFQSKVLNMLRPDGRIDANGRTHRKMNEKLLSIEAMANVNTSLEMPVTKAFWMKTAVNEVGESEVAGAKANPQILEYFKASKFWGSDDSGGQNAWCGSFVAWVMKQNNFEPVKNAFRAKEWTNFGKPIYKPVYGAIGIKSRQGGGHVAFVVGQSADGNYLFMLGGNQSNSVKVSKYKKEVWDDFVVPSNFDASSTHLPIYTQKASIAGSEA